MNVILDMVRYNSTQRGIAKKGVTYRQLLPETLETVYQYSGSFTTAPCNETVLWNVISRIHYISQRQVSPLKKMDVELKIRPLKLELDVFNIYG